METTELIVVVQGITLSVVALALLGACVVLIVRRRPVELNVARRILADFIRSYNRGCDEEERRHQAAVHVPIHDYAQPEVDDEPPPEVPDADIVNVSDAGLEQ